ncbi:MAG: DUF3267 domain-containing protein, partial [Candidatus Dormibacteraceae bacterium]
PRLVAGRRGLLPYLHTGSRGRVTRNGGLLTMLAPLVVVDLIGLALLLVPLTSGVGLIILVANSMGSVPDLWRAFQLLRLPRWVECEGRGRTTQIWAPSDHNQEAGLLRTGGAIDPPPLVGVVGAWVLCLLVAEAACAGGVRLLAQFRGSVQIGGLSLASTEQFVSGPDVVLNFWPLVVMGAALGTLAAAVWMLLALLVQRAGRRAREPRRAAA